MPHDAPNDTSRRQRAESAHRGWTLSISRRALTIAGIAFVVGLLIALALMFAHRNDNAFYRADAAATNAATGQQFEPLPVPQAGAPDLAQGDAGGAAPPSRTPAMGADGPASVPAPNASTPPLPPSPAFPAPGSPIASSSPISKAAADAAPRPLSAPQPVYPPAAMREGVGGTTLLQVEVGADGVPTRVQVVQSSRSRDLDRAALAAVQRWRFRPALRAGQPVPGKVLVPIAFNPG